ncbi:hypothetical protein F7984_09310 [Pradoshia sp. D12]|uniref:hypothetical protein n=1 Tax=Bacillaceae TaxID=186817 RepID=UPI00080AC4B4|nr:MULTISPECIES: hypothetical protein [Bacillaceae]OCA86813.1 hypothetical protein A8L44_05910 [Bacillus sp. FJAT-27986]QFK71419.1 hypothetical protein F7984_09310 [Pradoshia sp. D12]TPF73214.1 hypothetical protein FHY44_05705 [Bacillus sp. D12]
MRGTVHTLIQYKREQLNGVKEIVKVTITICSLKTTIHKVLEETEHAFVCEGVRFPISKTM